MEETELENAELRRTVFNLDGNPKVDYFYNKDGLLLKTYGWLVKKAVGIVLLIHGLKGHARFTYLKPNAEVIDNSEVLVIDDNNHYVYSGSWVEKFNQNGYSVYAMDLQGHGESEGRQNLRGHFKRFTDLVDDVLQYMNQIQDEISNDNKTDDESCSIVTTKKKLPMYVIGYSMGGNIALRILQLLNKAKKKGDYKLGSIPTYKNGDTLIGDFINIYDSDNDDDDDDAYYDDDDDVYYDAYDDDNVGDYNPTNKATNVSKVGDINNVSNDNTTEHDASTYCIGNDSTSDNDSVSTTIGGSDIDNTSVSADDNAVPSTSTQDNIVPSTNNIVPSISTQDNIVPSTSTDDNAITDTSANDNAEADIIVRGEDNNDNKYNCLDKLNIKGCVALSGMVSFERITQPGTYLFNYLYLPVTHLLSYIAPNVETRSELPYKGFAYVDNLCKLDKYRGKRAITVKCVYELIKAMGALNDDINYIPEDIPLLFVHARGDSICYYKGVKLFYDRLNSDNKELYTVDNMDHSITLEPGNEKILEKVIDWLNNLEKKNKNAIEDQE
ncbi:hypothetical protein YYE_03729 [Plasmodium vinckei vinckei]|uniref:Serine aminopeptidase S33 domain-containing protein n=1 Tax=Plasmodium vinckei vinckei TaxID=54757 RepID=A0A081ID71_PLAVN|nr:hypothetical protein YYE_03729 [Plasmodium vinckei vinckei]